jgi:hypothetical protein
MEAASPPFACGSRSLLFHLQRSFRLLSGLLSNYRCRRPKADKLFSPRLLTHAGSLYRYQWLAGWNGFNAPTARC